MWNRVCWQETCIELEWDVMVSDGQQERCYVAIMQRSNFVGDNSELPVLGHNLGMECVGYLC
jgi:hypothetical protein